MLNLSCSCHIFKKKKKYQIDILSSEGVMCSFWTFCSMNFNVITLLFLINFANVFFDVFDNLDSCINCKRASEREIERDGERDEFSRKIYGHCLCIYYLAIECFVRIGSWPNRVWVGCKHQPTKNFMCEFIFAQSKFMGYAKIVLWLHDKFSSYIWNAKCVCVCVCARVSVFHVALSKSVWMEKRPLNLCTSQ